MPTPASSAGTGRPYRRSSTRCSRFFSRRGTRAITSTPERKVTSRFSGKTSWKCSSGGGGDSGVGNDIFHDYLSHLRFIQDTVESFENKPVGQWPEAAWKGFYQLLQDELGEGSWNYVANPSGGFMAFYWHSFGSGGSEQYLQLEEEKLCFKISVDEEGRYSELRDKWHSRVVEAGEEAFVQVRKPDHFGHGGHMTVAVLEGGYLKTDEDGLIDIDKTVARLRKAEEILTRAAADG